MDINEALEDVTFLFLDTAPVIYFVEQHPVYFSIVNTIFDRIDQGGITAVTSPITLAECLIIPYKTGALHLQQNFLELVTTAQHTLFFPIDADMAKKAARLRAEYNLTLSDAFQIAAALETGCQAFLTNDLTLKRITALSVLVLNELTVGL
jgi:predicted nucleic acid-binding protein